MVGVGFGRLATSRLASTPDLASTNEMAMITDTASSDNRAISLDSMDLFWLEREPYSKLFELELLANGVECDLHPKVVEALKTVALQRYSHEESKGCSQPSFQKDFMEFGMKVACQCRSIRPMFYLDHNQNRNQDEWNVSMSKPEFHQNMELGLANPALSLIKEMKVASQCQPGEQNQNLNRGNFVTSQPEFHEEGGVDPALPKAIQIASVSREDDEAQEKRLQKMTRHEENLLILKVFLATTFPSKIEVSVVEERVKKMATTLARDDFERFNCSDEIANESREFSNKFLLCAGGREREQNVAMFLQMYMDFARGADNVLLENPVLGLRNFGFAKHIFEEGHHSRFVELARTVLLEHVPMVESTRIHSIPDFLVCPCGHAVDEFVQEAVSDVVWNPELEKLLTNDELNCLALADTIVSRFVGLAIAKCEILIYLSSYAGWVLVQSRRRYALEVYDLVQVADGLRRFQNLCFVSKHHILWAIRLTELKVLVDRLVESVGLTNVVEEPAKCPSYIVYKSTEDTADYHGNNVVEMEHLAVATVFEMERHWWKLYELNEEERKQKLHEFNKRECVMQFIRDVRDYERKCDKGCFCVKSNLNPEAKITSGGGRIHSAAKKFGVPKPLYRQPCYK
ncbi:hypothetical protein PTKIN_Ptkin01aG0322300 [Pterospermum kingtungense]